MVNSLDQLAGLRRMFASRQLRIVTFASATPEVGKSTLVANVAVELARQGQEVLVVDENDGNNLAAFFDLPAKGDLAQVLRGKQALEEALLSPFAGVCILPAGGLSGRLARLSAAERKALQNGIQALPRPIDVLLVDSSPDYMEVLSPWSLAGETVMVVSGARDAITDAYAMIRKIRESFDRRHFRILVNRVKNTEGGRVIFGNLKNVAAQRGIALLEYGGAIPFDSAVRQLGQLYQPIVKVLPDSPAAVALRGFASSLYEWPDAEYERGGVEQFVAQMLHSTPSATTRVLPA